MSKNNGNTGKPRIFISFTHADQSLAEYLATGLRRNIDDIDSVYCYTKPSKYDSNGGSRISDDFPALIDESINDSNIFLLLWSTKARTSYWVKYEYSLARSLFVKKAIRNGREFRIIPVRIDRCGLPFGLSNTVYASYSSGDNPINVLNEILEFIGYPSEVNDHNTLIVKQTLFELRTTFRKEKWNEFLQNYPDVINRHPHAISATIHYMYAISLLKEGHLPESIVRAHEALTFPQQESDTDLLYAYGQYLKGKGHGNDMIVFAQKALAIFPNDIRWQQIIMDSVNNSTSRTLAGGTVQTPLSSIQMPNILPFNQNSIPPQMQSDTGSGNMKTLAGMYPPHQNPSLQFAPMNGSFIPMGNGSPLNSSLPLPGIAPLSHNGTNGNAYFYNSTLPFNSAGLTSANMNSGQEENNPLKTRKLPEEELLQGDITSDDVENTPSFVEKYFSYGNITQILNIYTAFIILLNSIFFLFISLSFPSTSQLIGVAVLLISLILCIGKIEQKLTVKVFCICLLCLLWLVSGYCLGHLINSDLGWNSDKPIERWIEVMSTVCVVMLGSHLHVQFFYVKAKK